MAWDNGTATAKAREAVEAVATLLREDDWAHDKEGRDVMVGLLLEAVMALREADAALVHG